MSDTFCWLPPESDWMGCSVDPMRTRRRSTRSAIARRSGPRPTTPARASLRRIWTVALARTLSTGNRASPSPVAAEQDDPGAQRPERRVPLVRRSAARRAAGCALDARERAQELHLAVALGARDPEDLPLPHDEVDRAEALAAQARHREHDLGLLGQRAPLREGDLQRAPDHEGDESLLRDRRGLERPLADAVAEHRDAVGDREHLGQPVAHVHDADALARLLEHERVEVLDRLRAERGRRLVEEQHLRPRQQRLRDLEELPLGERERARGGRDGDVEPERRAASPPPSSACARTPAARRPARRGRRSRPPTGRARASSPGRRCRARAAGPRRGSGAGGGFPRSPPFPRPARGSRSRSRAMSISRTRSPRRGRGSRRRGSRR